MLGLGLKQQFMLSSNHSGSGGMLEDICEDPQVMQERQPVRDSVEVVKRKQVKTATHQQVSTQQAAIVIKKRLKEVVSSKSGQL